MPSHLTRHVFRRLLANQPIVHRGCLQRQASSAAYGCSQPLSRPRRNRGVQKGLLLEGRTFFNLFGPQKRDDRAFDLDPGIEKMMEYAKMERLKARLPSEEEVSNALRVFVLYKKKFREGITDTQAQLSLQSLQYCMRKSPPNVDAGTSAGNILSPAGLAAIDQILTSSVSMASDAHVKLCETILDALSTQPSLLLCRARLLATNVSLLGQLGRPVEARDAALQFDNYLSLARDNQSALPKQDHVHPDTCSNDDASIVQQVDRHDFRKTMKRLWIHVLQAFAKTQDEGELRRTLDMIDNRGLRSSPSACAAMLEFYVRGHQIEPVKHWFSEFWRCAATAGALVPAQVHQVLQWCMRNESIQYGHEVVQQVMQNNPQKAVWDVVLIWAAGNGKGADEIDRMLGVMESSNQQLPDNTRPRVPDIATINGLVEYAIMKNDPYLAERFIALGKEREIQPDMRTYVLQMQYRLKVKDTDGALIAYKNLQAMDLSTNEDVPTVNQLIVALCDSKRHDFDTIMNVTADLSDRRARFDPDTVATLCMLHLNRDEVHDVIDLLSTHSYHFSSSDRSCLRSSLTSYCIDPLTLTARAWDAYTIIRSIFDETPREARTNIMLAFFRRRRSDMAVHVFNGMRSHSRPDTIPSIDTYVSAFLATAELGELEILEVIHNQLKLDYNVSLDTRIRNALMIAYSSCGQPRRALSFWSDIVESREGPSYNSIHIALRACEKAPFGDLEAQRIWTELRSRRVELDQSLWASYAAALAGNGNTELAIRTVELAVENKEAEVDPFLVGSLYAASGRQSKQEEVASWCRDRFLNVWQILEKGGVIKDDMGVRTFQGIDRTIAP